MTLLVDIGNTRVRWTVEEDGCLLPYASCSHAQCREAWRHLEVHRARYCSVAVESATTGVTEALPGAQWRRVQADVYAGGVTNGYTHPFELGDDRWAALVGARYRYPGHNVVIVDAGTAVTIDVLAASGRHAGGVIVAGYRAQRAGLRELAPALPLTDGEVRVPARNTSDALTTGGYLGLAGAIEHVAHALGRDFADWTGLLTGGDAEALAPFLGAAWVIEPMLTLHGLQRLE